MAKVLLIVLLLAGLTAGFRAVAEWFRDTKNINILPASLIEMVAVIVFAFTYGSKYTDEIIWMWVSVAVVLAVTVFNLIKYGLKDGILASIAELFFSVSSAFLLLCLLAARGGKSKGKSYNSKRK